jgi:3-methyladenine DNA glycosylase/8-oxoguanine DNA glycosylase
MWAAAKHAKIAAVSNPSMELSLSARPPFNFLSVVNSHGWYQLAPFRFDEARRVLFYTDRLSTGRILEYRIAARTDGLKVHTAALNPAERKEVRERVAWMFGLDQDFSAFYQAARGEPKLSRARKLAHGRVLRSPTLFEDVVKTILTTNTLWAATRRMNLNLIDTFGAELDGSDPRAFPAPGRIAAASPEVLREKVRVGYRAGALHELAQRVASAEFDLESLKTSALPTLELRKELMKINGVGPYAAANLLMLLGRHDFIPIDSWALKVVSHEWYRGKPVTAKQVERRFKKWGAYKGLAYWFWDWQLKYEGVQNV